MQPSLFEPEATDPIVAAGFAEIVFDRPLDHGYTYAVPDVLRDRLRVGKRVLAPFGRGDKPTIGFCVGTSETKPERKVKAILEVLDDEALLTEPLLKLTRWMADYYLCGWGQVLNAVVPAGVKKQAGTRMTPMLELVPEALLPNPLPHLSPKQKRVHEYLKAHASPIELRRVIADTGCGNVPIEALVTKGYVRRRSGRVESATAISQPIGEPARSASDGVDNPSLAPDSSSLARSASDGVDNPSLELRAGLELTSDQAAAWATLEPALHDGGFRSFLLHGITGSGKTELYLRAIEEVVRHGKAALVLVPEISLTPQTIDAFRGRCGDIAVLHSHLHTAERGNHWRRIARGDATVIVGARSAVFAPTQNLGLIVIDEEHETSFKQEATPRYHARDVAVMRARLENIPIILGSATPSLESWHNAQRGQYTLLSLPRRVADRPLPHVRLIDLRHDRHPDKKPHGLSPSLERAMKNALDLGGQIMLLLNRRGYATYLHCPACGHVEQCKFCDLSMTFHRDRQVAMCHYCGFENKPPDCCAVCGTGVVLYQGMGTEKLQAEIEAKFPNQSVERMDSDTMKRPGSHQKVLDAFRRGEIHILLGTQMIAKGLDFPNVTLVGVVNADVGLHHADFRASERTFQLLAQVAGRTGRGDAGGYVYIQTLQPEHPSIALAVNHDYLTFAHEEMRVRRAHNYPPFQRLARLIVRCKDEKAGNDYADRLAAAFRVVFEQRKQANELIDLRLLGPAEAPVFRLKGYFRFHFQLHSASSAVLHEVLRAVLPTVRVPAGVELTVDIDPQDML
ncbi:MAG: primosomal protein N' [Planctomycetes bacterium]|nr:primosomal protein N' [Planctomycetota bacterium]